MTREAAIADLRRFIDAVNGMFEAARPPEEVWPAAVPLLAALVRSEALLDLSREWPDCAFENLVLYHDRRWGYVIDGLVRKPFHRAAIHDHAHTWTLYGILDGGERIDKYERVDDGSDPDRAVIKLIDSLDAKPGDVDILPPRLIHAEANDDWRAVAVTIRSEILGGFEQSAFRPIADAQPGHVTVSRVIGPTQIPFPLIEDSTAH